MSNDTTRRRFLVSSSLFGTAMLAGCAESLSDSSGGSDDMDDGKTETTTTMDDMGDGSDDMGNESDDMEDGSNDMDDGIEPTDPENAPRAMVDRFSEAAGTLMVRTEENGLPGPNEPIDFDQGPFITMGLGPDGAPVSYYNFDVQPTDPAPIYTFVREGDGSPVEDQLNVIGVKPGDDGYNDFWHVHKVTVPESYEANTITSSDALMEGDYDVEVTDVIKNCPVVPDGSTATMRLGDEPTGLVEGWYDGKVVSYFLFEEAPLLIQNGSVPTSPIYVTFNENPDEDGGGPPSGFVTEGMSEQTHNVVATLPGDESYSPLWYVNVYDNADFDSVSDLDSAKNATLLASGAATVNCPIVATN